MRSERKFLSSLKQLLQLHQTFEVTKCPLPLRLLEIPTLQFLETQRILEGGSQGVPPTPIFLPATVLGHRLDRPVHHKSEVCTAYTFQELSNKEAHPIHQQRGPCSQPLLCPP